jgi:hypothetical protein
MSSRRSMLGILLTVAALTAGCGGKVLEPNVDCSRMVGQVSIELQPRLSGLWYEVSVGDSIRITASLHRTTQAEPVWDLGWTCAVTSKTPVSGTVNFSTDDTQVISLGTGGWIRGLSRGLAGVTASSQQAAYPLSFGVFVY